MLRLGEADGREALNMVQLISCPGCGEQLRIDDDTPAGSIVSHDGINYTLTKEFGAFALVAK